MLICPLAKTFNFRDKLIIRLRQLNYKVVLLSENGPEITRYTQEGCQFEEIQMDRRGTSFLRDSRLIVDYYKTIKRINPDVVLTYTTKCSVYGGLVCRMLKIPYIINNAGLMDSKGILSFVLNLLYRIGFAGASCMMYQNGQEQRVVQNILRNKTHYRRIPGSGVDLEKFTFCDYPNNDEQIVFNFVARIMKSKGIEEYLECAKQIHTENPNTLFRIYGSFDDEKYRRIIDEYEKAGYVKYCGQQSKMQPAIKSAHAVIHPSYYEGMTNVILEHSAMGRPCLGSNVPGVQDGIDNGKTGFVFKVRNVEDMVDKVSTFVKLPYEQKKEMGENARIKMEKEFNRSIITETYIKEIERIDLKRNE